LFQLLLIYRSFILGEATDTSNFPFMAEIIFEVEGGFVATAPGHSIATQGVTLEELREMPRSHFSDGAPGPMPKIIGLHFVRDEALAA
jgi:hypothetical protein